jgi:hypothetical protein
MNKDSRYKVVVLHTRDADPTALNLDSIIGEAGCSVRYVCVGDQTLDGSAESGCEKFTTDLDWATTLIVLITPDATENPCLNWLINYSKQENKRVIALWHSASEQPHLPDSLDGHADAIMPVTGERVRAAICGDFNDWENPDGSPYQPREISRHRC